VYGAFSRREFIGLKEQEIRSFVYVQDVVDVILKLMERYNAVVGDHCGASSTGASRDTSGGSHSGSSVSGVYNVGGPVPLSRLNVACSLCSVLGAELVVTAPPGVGVMVREVPNPSAPWRVYVMDTPTGTVGAVSGSVSVGTASGYVSVGAQSTTTNATLVQVSAGAVPVAVHGELRSPRDISMDSTATERALGVVFTSIEQILVSSLNVH
jgi:hypothetical protein